MLLQTKFVSFAVVALMAVGSAVAIKGGKDAARGQFPYFAYLESYTLPNKPQTVYSKCGGALIKNRWILTSAQCLDMADGAEIHLGLKRLFDKNEDGRQIFNVTKKNFFIHTSYKKDMPFLHDIALIKLPSTVESSKYVRSISLPFGPTLVGEQVTTMGYGLVYTNVFPQNLQYTNFQTIDMNQCGSIHPSNLIPKHSSVCAKGIESGLCYGDMGDPLVSAYTGKLVGIAISAWGDCDVGPQRFTGILPYIGWIDRVTSSGFVQNTPDIHI